MNQHNRFLQPLVVKTGFLIALALGLLVVVVVFLPQFRQRWLALNADNVTISYPN